MEVVAISDDIIIKDDVKLFPSLPAILFSKTSQQPLSLPLTVKETLNYWWNASNQIFLSVFQCSEDGIKDTILNSSSSIHCAHRL
jgi:hypothetical protein